MTGAPIVRLLASAAGLAIATAGGAQDAANPRQQLEKMERALAEAARRVSRPAALPVLGAAEICRGYRLQGVGAWFVVAPRSLPEKAVSRGRHEQDLAKADDELAQAISNLERGVQSARSDAERHSLRGEIDALTERRRELRRRAHPASPRERELRAWQERAEAMHQAAADARLEAAKAIQMLEKMRGHIDVEGETTAAPHASQVSAQPRSAHAMPPMPLPPWRHWLESETVEETRAPEDVLKDVREAITQAIAEHGPALPLPANEMIAVAVDFFRPTPLACSKPPARTLVIRAPKRVLLGLASGSLSREDARKQFETLEY